MTPEFNSNFVEIVEAILNDKTKNPENLEKLCNAIKNNNNRTYFNSLIEIIDQNKEKQDIKPLEYIWWLFQNKLQNEFGITTEDQAGKLASGIFRNGNSQPKDSEGKNFTRMIYYVCAALDLTFEQTEEVCSKLFFKRPFYVRCSIDAVFYVFFKLRDKGTERTDMIKSPKKGETDPLYEYLSNEYYNSTRAFTREQKSNDVNIICELDSIVEKISIEPSALADYLKDNYRKPEKKGGRYEKNANYQNTAITEVKKQLHINCLIYSFLKKPENNNIKDIFEKWINDLADDKSENLVNLVTLWFSFIFCSEGIEKYNPVFGNLPFNERLLKNCLPDIMQEESKSRVNSTSLRKMLIISYFYNYHVLKANYPATKWQSFRAHMDELLEKCGFQKLYEGNPFDAIFLVSAKYTTSYEEPDMTEFKNKNGKINKPTQEKANLYKNACEKYPNVCTLYKIWYQLSL